MKNQPKENVSDQIVEEKVAKKKTVEIEEIKDTKTVEKQTNKTSEPINTPDDGDKDTRPGFSAKKKIG